MLYDLTDGCRHIHAHALISPLGSTSLVAAASRALDMTLPQPLYRDPFAAGALRIAKCEQNVCRKM